MAKTPGRLRCNRGNLAVHVKHFTLVHTQGFYAVLIRVGMNGFLKGLTQQVLAAFWVGDQTI